MSLEVIETDKFFYDSPDAGNPDCTCSRCGNMIKENEMPIRCWPTEPGDYGYDPEAKDGTEFRYCQSCSEKMGVQFAPNDDDEDYENEPEPPAHTQCRKCGRKVGIEGEMYIGISEDGYCSKCIAGMEDDGQPFNY